VPRIETPRFGPIDYPEDAVIHFPAGLPAFESDTQFIAIERPDSSPIIFLQSVLHPALCFFTLPALVINPGYRLALCAEDLLLLGLPRGSQPEIGGDLVCLSILTIPEAGPATANLMAPVVIRRDTRRGVQVVQGDGGYSHRHPLFGGAEVPPCS
jgi:flagellar assembly factor FliW